MYFIGFLVTSIVIGIITAMYLIHVKKTMLSIREDDLEEMHRWAKKYAYRLAKVYAIEMLKNASLNVRIECVNESDIDWGEGENR